MDRQDGFLVLEEFIVAVSVKHVCVTNFLTWLVGRTRLKRLELFLYGCTQIFPLHLITYHRQTLTDLSIDIRRYREDGVGHLPYSVPDFLDLLTWGRLSRLSLALALTDREDRRLLVRAVSNIPSLYYFRLQ